MKLIIGLGNPGSKYAHTRHNTGFMFLDFLYEKFKKDNPDIEWEFIHRFKGFVCEFKIDKVKIALLKPTTYMNESGWSASQYMNWNNISKDKVILAHDDLDIPFGMYKFNTQKSPKVHYGVLSVEAQLKTKEFTRLRIGVDNRQASDGTNKIGGVAYLMSNFTNQEEQTLAAIFEKAYLEILQTLKEKSKKKDLKDAKG